MASSAPIIHQTCTVKHLARSDAGSTSIPNHYKLPTQLDSNIDVVHSATVPTVDISLLTSVSPAERSQAVHELGKACRDWGFFMVMNHGVSERLREEVMKVCEEFFELPEEMKKQIGGGKHVLDPIRCGTSFNTSVEKVHYWRDFLKVFVYPDFHYLAQLINFREVVQNYSIAIRDLMKKLLSGISESLSLEPEKVEETLQINNGLQVFVANLYPPCPQQNLTLGMPPHSDQGLLTILMQNHIGGLQLMHNGKWVQVDPAPNSFLVNIGDHMEILSNGRYKSVLHRAVVNSQSSRISVVMPHGPALDVDLGPMSELVDDANHPPKYLKMKYRDYFAQQQSTHLDGKASLDMVRL